MLGERDELTAHSMRLHPDEWIKGIQLQTNHHEGPAPYYNHTVTIDIAPRQSLLRQTISP